MRKYGLEKDHHSLFTIPCANPTGAFLRPLLGPSTHNTISDTASYPLLFLSSFLDILNHFTAVIGRAPKLALCQSHI